MTMPTVRRRRRGPHVTRLARAGPFLVPAVVALLARAIALATSGVALVRLEPSTIADNLNAGRGFTFEQYGTTYHAWKEPLYIALLAAVTRISESDAAILVLQWSFGAAAAVALAALARQITGDARAAAIAGVIAALNPFLVYYDTSFVHPLSMDTFLFVLTTALNVRAAEASAGHPGRVVTAGLVTGLALWQRATLMVAGGALWAAAVVSRRGRRLGHALLWAAVALAVLTPWLARNYAVLGRVVLTTDAAHILWLGNNERSNGTYSDGAGRRVFDVADPAFKTRVAGRPELEQSDAFVDAVRAFIVTHPGRFLALVGERFLAFFLLSPNAGVEYSARQILGYVGAYALLMIAGLVGLVEFWRRGGRDERRRTVLVLASVLGLAALHGLMAINMKHRVPWEMVLSLFAGVALASRAPGVRRDRHV